MKFLKIPLRYIFINKKRSLICSLSIFVAAIIVAIGYSWIYGMIDNIVNSYKNYQTGNIKFINKDYLKNEKFLPVDYFISDSKNLKNLLFEQLEHFFKDKKGYLKNFQIVERFNFYGFAGKLDKTNFVQIFSFEFEKEKERFNFEKNIISGSINLNKNEIIIGSGLAKKLKVNIDDYILISSQTFYGGLNARKYKVKGIVRVAVSYLDNSTIFMNLNDAKELVKLDENYASQILLFFDIRYTDEVFNRLQNNIFLKNDFKENNIISQKFYEVMGAYYNTLKIMEKFLFIIFFGIVFFASFVIINTMMMNIFERINEIGTLKALGFSDNQIFLLNILEGTIIGMIGGIPGAIFGYLLTYLMNYYGIDFSRFLNNVDLLMESIIRPNASLKILFWTIVLSILAPAVATIIPSRYAKNLNPTEALKHL